MDRSIFTADYRCATRMRHAQRRFSIWCRKAGVERRISPHDLRHSFAIRLYKRTRDLLLVQQALRHRSIASTCVYARLDEGRLREVLAMPA